MSKPLLVALLAALVCLPAASAQVTSSVTLGGLPSGSFETNETLAVIPFSVTYEISNLVCLGSGATVTVTLAATAQGNGSDNVTTEVEPAQMTFTVPPAQAATSYQQTQGGVLTLRPDSVFTMTTNVTANLSATVTGLSGCTGASAENPSDEADIPVSFQRARGASDDPGQALPGPGFALLVVAFLAVALFARRK